MAQDQFTLAEYLARLKTGEVDPLPAGTEEWADHIRRVSATGTIAEITEDQYDYWLEVLPPHWMRGSQFCFAEGAEPFRLFWRDRPTGRYLVRPCRGTKR